EAARPFDLAAGPLLRCRLLGLGPQTHVLLLTLHHLVCDGWSIGRLFQELTQFYAGRRTGAPAALPPLAVQYADYARWQRAWLTEARVARAVQYWRQQLPDADDPLRLPLRGGRPAVQRAHGARHRVTMTPALTTALRQVSRAHDVTLFMTLLAGFQTLLHRYTGRAAIRVGTPVAGRTHLASEPLIGCFVNTLVLRTEL